MGRGSNVCVEKSKSSRKRRTPSMEIESDEEYKVDEDEERDDSDEDCSLDGDESEDFLADFEEEDEEVKTKAKRVPRSKKARKNLPARKANRLKVPRKKRRASYTQEAEDEEEEYEEDEDEDEDDDEFMPDDSDSVDDEDEKPKMEKYEKPTKQPSQKMDSIKVQRNSRKSKAFRRLTRQKLRNSRSRMRKTNSTNSMPVADKNVVLKRKRRLRRIDSDSDFASPASSDYEYTISEEEREQMREANVICADVKSNLRSCSIGKRWEQEQKTVCQKRKCPPRKGKEKVDDMKDNEVVKQVCGVCLSEEGKRTVQGSLNCCTHYFCFPCIMEWSKVESRCPLCKQRFTTISKAARSNTGFDLRTVVIQIPERDQVYQPSEEELQAYLDPYESVICTECHQGGDDALMLLCDICDSPAHTFCVGLGHEVPEGNWYCEGCRPSVFGSLVNSQGLAPIPDRRPSRNFRGLSLGIDLNEMYVPETTLTQETGVQTSRHTVGEFHPVSPASTVRDRRILHQHIHRLNRMSHFSSGRSSETPTSSTGLRLFGAQLDQGRERDLLTSEQRLTRLDENDNMPSVRDRDDDPPSGMRWSQSRGQGQSSTSVPIDRSLQGESGAGFNPVWGFGQLHPFISRSSIAPDASPSPYACREARGPSRTSQGSLNTPY